MTLKTERARTLCILCIGLSKGLPWPPDRKASEAYTWRLYTYSFLKRALQKTKRYSYTWDGFVYNSTV